MLRLLTWTVCPLAVAAIEAMVPAKRVFDECDAAVKAKPATDFTYPAACRCRQFTAAIPFWDQYGYGRCCNSGGFGNYHVASSSECQMVCDGGNGGGSQLPINYDLFAYQSGVTDPQAANCQCFKDLDCDICPGTEDIQNCNRNALDFGEADVLPTVNIPNCTATTASTLQEQAARLASFASIAYLSTSDSDSTQNIAAMMPARATLLTHFPKVHTIVVKDECLHSIVVAVRGTDKSSIKDIYTDLRYSTEPFFAQTGARAHSGFMARADAIIAEISNYIPNQYIYSLPSARTWPLTFTGHSLGAGVSALLTAAMTVQWNTSIWLDPKMIRGVGFATPKPTLHDPQNYFGMGERFVSFAYNKDLVTRVRIDLLAAAIQQCEPRPIWKVLNSGAFRWLVNKLNEDAIESSRVDIPGVLYHSNDKKTFVQVTGVNPTNTIDGYAASLVADHDMANYLYLLEHLSNPSEPPAGDAVELEQCTIPTPAPATYPYCSSCGAPGRRLLTAIPPLGLAIYRDSLVGVDNTGITFTELGSGSPQPEKNAVFPAGVPFLGVTSSNNLGYLAVGAANGLFYIWNEEDATLNNFTVNQANPAISTIDDKSGTLWVALSGGGVSYVDLLTGYSVGSTSESPSLLASGNGWVFGLIGSNLAVKDSSGFRTLGAIDPLTAPCTARSLVYGEGHLFLLTGLTTGQTGSCPSSIVAYKIDWQAWTATKVTPTPAALTLQASTQGEFLVGDARLMALATAGTPYQITMIVNPLVGKTPAVYNASLPRPVRGRFIKNGAPPALQDNAAIHAGAQLSVFALSILAGVLA